MLRYGFMRNSRPVRIVCTVGPACRAAETLERMLDAGMDVARINFAHGSADEHRDTVAQLRRAAAERGRPIAILQDLAGPKLRIGELEAPLTLRPGDAVTIACDASKGSGRTLPVPDPWLTDEVGPGDPILIADGQVELQVLEISGRQIHCGVVVGGEVSSRKGINAPGGLSARPILDDADRAALRLGAELEIDFVGVSYVRTAEDLAQVRLELRSLGRPTPLVAKIETGLALEHLDDILAHTDALMIARGDLSLEIPYERVPIEQKRIVEAARRAGRPVITATQMLQSMVSASRPTRAEATDVANAVLDGTDAVMLSDETAVGRDPVRACRTMARIIEETASSAIFSGHLGGPSAPSPEGLSPELRELDVFAAAAVRTARDVGARAIVTWSRGGLAARLLSRQRPDVPILAPTRFADTWRKLSLPYGVVPVLCPRGRMTREQLVGVLGPVDDRTLLLVVGHVAGERRRIPRMELVRVIDARSWTEDPRAAAGNYA
ncbi:MAG: pyruvate kinase [Deltaproteobacteria bacterium]|nr:pyruvate kinase [Deltaproteobacteria bacterium]